MPRLSKKPKPPVNHFVDGAVWRIRVGHRALGLIWNNATTEPKDYLIMVRAGIGGRSWSRTRIVVGDLAKRRKEDIYADFITLMRQSPPVVKNYRAGLNNDHGDLIEWLDYEGSIR